MTERIDEERGGDYERDEQTDPDATGDEDDDMGGNNESGGDKEMAGDKERDEGTDADATGDDDDGVVVEHRGRRGREMQRNAQGLML